MAVRITFYAIDLIPFEQFLEKSLGETLKFVAENGREEDVLCFHTDAGRYLASARYGINHDDLQGGGRGYVEMSAADVDADPNLSVSCREHLAQGNASELSSLLRALASCSGLPWVNELSGGERRWWIGSLLDWAEGSDAFGSTEYAQYEDLFFKVLRGYHCAKLPAVKWSRLSSTDFPVIPVDEGAVSAVHSFTYPVPARTAYVESVKVVSACVTVEAQAVGVVVLRRVAGRLAHVSLIG